MWNDGNLDVSPFVGVPESIVSAVKLTDPQLSTRRRTGEQRVTGLGIAARRANRDDRSRLFLRRAAQPALSL